ncbi:MAG: DUF885 family protein, partial [Dokdonella sp.]
MRLIVLSLVLVSALIACQKSEIPPDAVPSARASLEAAADTAAADAVFAELSKRALDGWLRLSPVSATQIGEHEYDTELDDLSAAGRKRSIDFARTTLAELDALDAATLSRENQVDVAILRNQLKYGLWDAETLQSWATDPQVYSGLAGGAIYNLMAREFAPLPERLRSASARMEKLPALFAQARTNLDPARVPKIHAETVAKQNAGVLSIIEMFIAPHLQDLPETDRARAEKAIETLKIAVAEHQLRLDNTLVPSANGDFRVGQDVYDQKLEFALLSSL